MLKTEELLMKQVTDLETPYQRKLQIIKNKQNTNFCGLRDKLDKHMKEKSSDGGGCQ